MTKLVSNQKDLDLFRVVNAAYNHIFLSENVKKRKYIISLNILDFEISVL